MWKSFPLAAGILYVQGETLYCLSTTWQTERNFTADRLNKAKQPDRDRRNKNFFFFNFVDRESRYILLKKDQLDALFIFSIQLIDLHISTTDFIYIT